MLYNAGMYDPVLGRFAQADSIIPNGAQGYDRYAYVNNSPINYADPSGNIPIDCYGTDYCGSSNSSDLPDTLSGGESGEPNPGGGSNSCDTNGNGVADIPCLGLSTRDWEDGRYRLGTNEICPLTSIIECYYLHASLNMGQDPMNIDLQEFQALLLAIYYEVNGRNSAELIVSSMSFDTPFYDQGVFGIGALPGTGCIEGSGCYARHELNYIAQGVIAAAAGESRTNGQMRVHAWKLYVGPLKEASPGTIEMWNIGYDFYYTQNGSSPPPNIPIYDKPYDPWR
jgi:hypothetical protein